MFRRSFKLQPASPLRSSDRRKLRNSVIEHFLDPVSGVRFGDLLVPEGVRVAKFTTHDEAGVLYMGPDSEPLWFTIGKNSDALVPTVYTLWKLELVPFLTTPLPAIEKVLGGADLMIPGVIESVEDGDMPSISENALVAVCQPNSRVPLAIGRMALPSYEITSDSKGKAVKVLHTWKDTLFEVGPQLEPPESVPAPADPPDTAEVTADIAPPDADSPSVTSQAVGPSITVPEPALSPSDLDAILRQALLQAIRNLAKLPPQSTFPIPASTFYSSHILPSRPASAPPTSSDIIKRSSYKKVSKLLQVAEKDGFLKLKDFKGDLNVLGVFGTHPDIISHKPFKTVGDVEAKEVKAAQHAADAASQVSPIVISELFRPHLQSLKFFEEHLQKPKDAYYTSSELRTLLDEYITLKSLIHPREASYALLDDPLKLVLLKKNEDLEFVTRGDLLPRLQASMQPWYSMQLDGKEPVFKKGELKPIQVTSKIRAGKKTSTLISQFEPFHISAEFLSEELRRICASATSVNPLPGKGAGVEVHIQGKQIKAVVELLLAQGVPKKWIQTSDLTAGKKK